MGLASGPTGMKEAIKELMPRCVVVRRLDRRAANCVLLTFDDGPDPEITPAVLDRLDAHGAKAVFFVIGRRIKRAPRLLNEILERGHRLGNHSHLHRMSYVRSGPPQVGISTYYRDLARCQARIEHQVGRAPGLYRPPGGRLVPKTLISPHLLGLKCVTWSQDIRDWSFKEAAEGTQGGMALASRVEERDIILLHDNHTPVLSLLDTLLPGLRERGFDLTSGINHL